MLSRDKLISENKFLEKENSDLLGELHKCKEEIELLKCEITTLKILNDNLKEENKTLQKEAKVRMQLFEGLISEKFKLEDKIKVLEQYNNFLKKHSDIKCNTEDVDDFIDKL